MWQAAETEASRAGRLLEQVQPHWMGSMFRIMLALELHEMDSALQGVQVQLPASLPPAFCQNSEGLGVCKGTSSAMAHDCASTGRDRSLHLQELP